MHGALVFIDAAAETEAVVEGTVLSVGHSQSSNLTD